MEENKLRIAIGHNTILLEDIIDVIILNKSTYNFSFIVIGIHPHQRYTIAETDFIKSEQLNTRKYEITFEKGESINYVNKQVILGKRIATLEVAQSYLKLLKLLRINPSVVILTPSYNSDNIIDISELEGILKTHTPHITCPSCKGVCYNLTSSEPNSTFTDRIVTYELCETCNGVGMIPLK